MAVVTVLGSSGFIGSHLVKSLSQENIPWFAPSRDDVTIFKRDLGHVVYCIGLTADYRQRPFDTVKAHVCRLLDILENADFQSFLYLSSTRVYLGAENTKEDTALKVNPLNTGDLYNISKIMGESLCMASERHNVRIARLSNVVGSDYNSENFLNSVLREASVSKIVVLRTSLDSEKDYIGIDDVVTLLPLIARKGKRRLYNVASGINVSNGTLQEYIRKETGCDVEVAEGAETIIYPEISIDTISSEFNFRPRPLLELLGGLLSDYRESFRNED